MNPLNKNKYCPVIHQSLKLEMGKEELKISKPSGAVNPLYSNLLLLKLVNFHFLWPHVYRASELFRTSSCFLHIIDD